MHKKTEGKFNDDRKKKKKILLLNSYFSTFVFASWNEIASALLDQMTEHFLLFKNDMPLL